jgi:signal transduction histidine kinase
MTDLYDAAVALVVAGLSVGLTMFWLRHLSRQHRRRMDQLLALREALHADLPGTLVRSQKILADLGLRSLDWRGNWYGSPVFTRLGAKIPTRLHAGTPLLAFEKNRSNDRVLQQHFQYDDISLEFRIGLKGLRGERHLFAVQAAEVLFAMIQGALAARQLALVAAVSQRARVGVFLQHDMRNLAQWVQLVAEDFAGAEDDQTLMQRARRLRSNAPLAANRAERMAQALLNPTWQASLSAPLAPLEQPEPDMLDLDEHIRQAGLLHQVAIELEGGAWLQWDGAALATVLDNVLGNVSNLSRERQLAAHCRVVVLDEGPHIAVHFETPHLPLEIALNKLFEPWASSGAVNRGLGMYQARKQAQLAGGELSAERLNEGLRVTLRLPCKKS